MTMKSWHRAKQLATFSIVAFDPSNGDLGIAVQSKFLAVGAVVPWARAGVGAVATQSWANTSYGPRGLALMEQGFSAEEVVEKLIAEDENRKLRQVGLVDAQGQAAAYTGEECFPWKGHHVGQNYTCQGNILVGEETVTAIARSFEECEGELADRLIAALRAGQAAGGDSRGKQSAALLVVREKGGYAGFNDRYVDLRVDDHPDPIEELARLLELHKLYFLEPRAEDLIKIEGPVAEQIQVILAQQGYYQGPINGIYDEDTREALVAFCRIENLEERLREDDTIDGVVLKFMRERFGHE
ncbi:MAG: DUF1028 domain-containing protein [Anaerolineae bacterium]